jgi:ribosomal protein S18 acetylase RimI-like enzyme
MNLEVEIVRDAKNMELAFSLVKQLSPEITREDYTQYISEMVKSNYFQIFIRNNEKHLVAVSGIWLATKLYCGKYLEMDNVVVDEAYRSAGLGKILYEKSLEIAMENNCKVLMLDAYKENTRAHEFYEQKGFVKRGFHFIKKL